MASEWSELPLGEVMTLQRGFDLPSQKRKSGKVPIVSSSGISDYHSEVGVKGPGVVTGRYGTIGQVFLIKEDYWPLNTTLWVKDFQGNDPHFSSYLLRTIDFRSCSDKSSVPGVNRNDLHRIPVLLPPLAEQKAIAAELGALDDKIELNQRMNATLEAMARALFQSWFVDFDPVRAKVDGRQPEGMNTETAAHFPNSFQESAVGKIPKGWKTSCLGQHVSMQRGTTYKSKLKDLPGPYLLGLGSIARNGGFKDNKLRTYGGDSPEKLIVRPGDIFASLKDVTQSADLLGAVARVPSYIAEGRLTQDTVKLIFDGEPISQNLAYEVLMAPDYRAYCRNHATGTTNLGLSRDDFFAYPVVLPSTEIQELFEEFSKSVNQQINQNNDQSRTLATLRDTLQPKLLSGELSSNAVNQYFNA